jgi:hypothetical protein
MRFGWLILLLLPFGANAQTWFKTDSTFTENPFYYQYTRGDNFFTRPLYSLKQENEKQYLVVNPWFDVKLSKAENESLIKNGRGLLIEGQHGRFRFFSGLQEVQDNAYEYERGIAANSVALRGHNRTKTDADNNFDYADFIAGLQYQGNTMRYSIGWHPVKVGSGIRPMFVSHLNTGFFNYQIGFTSKNKKITVSHGNGIFFGTERLQSNSASEAGFKRSQLNWLNAEYSISQKLSVAVHMDAYSEMFTDSSEQLRPKLKHYFPIPLSFDDKTTNRLGGEIKYFLPKGKLYVGALNTGVLYTGFTIRKTISDKLNVLLSAQATKHSLDSANQIAQFGNEYTSAYSYVEYDGLTNIQVRYQNIRLESSINYFKGETTDGLNIFASLGYCIHPPSEMLVNVFVEERKFPKTERYVGIGIRNNLGLSRKTY